MSRLEFAAVIYRHRNLSKEERKATRWAYQPRGFKVGSFKKWYPLPLEVRPCCQAIEEPQPQYPFTYHRHCRTVKHCAALMDVDEKDLARLVGLERSPARCATCSRFRKQDDYLCKVCRQRIDEEMPDC